MDLENLVFDPNAGDGRAEAGGAGPHDWIEEVQQQKSPFQRGDQLCHKLVS